MSVPFLDLGAATAELRGPVDAAIAKVLDDGWYVGGPALEGFEDDFAAFVAARHCVGVANGLDALRLTLMALDIGSGDEVIVASNGFVATFLAVSAVGAVPVPVEPDPATHNLDPSRVEAVITPRTRAILPTHLYGQPADLDPLLALACQHDLRLIEDAAQAHGARYRGQRIGAHGDAVCWSFYPSKNLGALGDGGAVTTNDEALAARIRALGNYGSTRRYYNAERGLNSRLDPLHAAALSVKLPHLDAWNDRRRAVAARYLDGLADTSLTLPHVPNFAKPVWHLFVVGHARRDSLAAHLADREIQTLIHYPVPPHRQDAYRDLELREASFPIAERLADQVLSLPIGPHLSLDQADEVIAAIRDFDKAGA